MAYQIKLKNTEDKIATLDEKGFKAVTGDKYLNSLKFTENLRAHASGYPIYQRCITTKTGPVYETIYLHRWLADKFMKKPQSDRKLFLRFKNGNVQDCRIENFEYVTMTDLRKDSIKKRRLEGQINGTKKVTTNTREVPTLTRKREAVSAY